MGDEGWGMVRSKSDIIFASTQLISTSKELFIKIICYDDDIFPYISYLNEVANQTW